MTQENSDYLLTHFGVKGQKWGQRESNVVNAREKFDRGTGDFSLHLQVHNAAAPAFNHRIADLNKKYSKDNFTFPSQRGSLRHREYIKAEQKIYVEELSKAAIRLGTNLSGAKQYDIREQGTDWILVTGMIQHNAQPLLTLRPVFDRLGHTISLTAVGNDLAHHGVKGMKWGVRKSYNRVTTGRRPKSRAHKPRSNDAVKAEKAQRKVRTKGVRSLSNDELNHLTNRLNLEQRYSQLNKNPATEKVKKGHDYVKLALAAAGTAQAIYTFAHSPLGKQLARQFESSGGGRHRA